MKPTPQPPKAVEAILKMILPASVYEEVLGDLEERFHTADGGSDWRPAMRYSVEALRIIPFLLALHMRTLATGTVAARLAMMSALVSIIIVWEAAIVRQQAWPITADFLDISPVSGMTLFLGIYSLLYLFGILLVFAFSVLVAQSAWRRAGRLVRINPLWLAAALSVLPAINILYPQAMDSIWMRLFQLAAIWGIALAARYALRRLAPIDPCNTNSQAIPYP